MTAAVLTSVLVAGGVRAASQDAAPPAVFTAEQAAEGKATYAKACASCHLPDLSGNNDAPPLAGATFLSSWSERSTKDLLDYMAGTMPPGGGALAPEAYLTIAAHVLQANGAASGSRSYTPETAVRIGSLIPPRPGSAD